MGAEGLEVAVEAEERGVAEGPLGMLLNEGEDICWCKLDMLMMGMVAVGHAPDGIMDAFKECRVPIEGI